MIAEDLGLIITLVWGFIGYFKMMGDLDE